MKTTNATTTYVIIYDESESTDSYVVLDYTPAMSTHYLTKTVPHLINATHYRSRFDAQNAMAAAKLDPQYYSVVRVTTTTETE